MTWPTEENHHQRLVARVKHVDVSAEIAYLEHQNGTIQPYYMDGPDELKIDAVVLVGPRWIDVERAPSEMWEEPLFIGTVRCVLDDEIIIAIGDRLRSFLRPEGLEVSERATVEIRESQGIVRVITDKPIKLFDISIGDEIDIDLFKTQPGESPSFDDFGGYEEIVARAQELVELPLMHHDALLKIGARPIKGVLFTGLPGTGKTMLAKIIANQAGAQFYQISGPEIISKWVGHSEEVVRRIFEDAKKQSRAIIFFDEIDSVAPQRGDESHEASRRIVGQLLTLMDGFNKETNVVVIATTNRPQDIDVALRRPGRFDWEVEFTLPTLKDRQDILARSADKHSVGDGLPHDLVAEMTELWSPADLAAIWSEAAILAVQDGREVILEEDYLGGVERVSRQRIRVAVTRSDKSEDV